MRFKRKIAPDFKPRQNFITKKRFREYTDADLKQRRGILKSFNERKLES